jgi:hypothetical protein
LVTQRRGSGKYAPATREKLLSFPGEAHSPADAVEQGQPEFRFEIDNLSRQSRLRDMKASGSFRDGPVVGNGDERLQVLQVDDRSICQNSIKNENNCLLDS